MKIFRFLIIFFLLVLNIFAKDLSPQFSLIASGAVTDLVLKEDKLFVATSASKIDIFNINTKEKIDSIKIPKIKDFMQDVIDSKIYSVDVLKNNILILSQGQKGGRNIDIYKDGKIENIIEDKDRLFIARAKFIDENHIIYSLLSNQIYLYDIKNKKILSEIQVSQSKFSHFKLNEDKSKILIADESGILTLLNTKDLNVIKKFDTLNLDNVFQVDIKKDLIITAGQDRRCGIYSLDEKTNYYKEASFLIYSVALSPSASLSAFASDEENNVTIFNTNTKENLHKLTQNRSTLTNILFINENEIFVSSDDENINYYKLN
uniref:WD40 repeat domain-containing protein n=1 Tax=Aliarcobacter sp. TaxID=2321116 RepID=UPI004047CC33